MDKDILWRGSSAVASARIWIAVFSWIAIIAGFIVVVLEGYEFDGFLIGCCIIAAGISGLILKAVLRGLETIVYASEAYLKDRQDLKDKNEEKAE